MSVLSQLETIYQEVKENTPEYLEAVGTFKGKIGKVTFNADNKWGDGTQVPQVVIPLEVIEGEHEGELAYLNLNLNGREAEQRNIALSVFISTMRKMGLDTDGKTLQDLVESAIKELPGKEVEFEMVESESKKTGKVYINAKFIGLC